MKKSLLMIITMLLLFVSPAFADNFDYYSFIGEWNAPNSTEDTYSRLQISYCDGTVINADFEIVKDGYSTYDYILYEGNMTDNEAVIPFSVHDGEKIVSNGTMTLSFYIDNIWISMYSDNGDEVYNGMVLSSIDGFNPYYSPFSYDVTLKLNGIKITPPKNPVIINGRTFVPLRGMFDYMNINVFWSDFYDNGVKTQMITATKGSEIVELKRTNQGIGNTLWEMKKWASDSADVKPDTMGKNPSAIDILDVQPILMDGSSYVPLRVIAESFGADVEWDDSLKTVNITYNLECDTKRSEEEIAYIESFTPYDAIDMVKSFYTHISPMSDYPYYTSTSKYYLFNCIRNGMKLVAKVDCDGNTLEYTQVEWYEQ